MNSNFHYYVVYGYNGGEGCCQTVRTVPIKNFNDVLTVARSIEKDRPEIGNVIIKSWVLLKE
jgi:predicted methyltransferase